jgi:VWFA-related protein
MIARVCRAAAACCLGATFGALCAAQEASGPPGATPSVQVNVNRVLAPVVVRDREGHTVGDLQERDFTVLDDGKPRAVSGFLVERHAPAGGGGQGGNVANPAGGGSGKGAAAATGLPDRVTVFLFDDLHIAAEDLSRVKKAASGVLAELVTGTDVAAVVSLSGAVNSGLTRDREKLQAALTDVQARGPYRTDKGECPKIDYYQADLIVNKNDSTALDALTREVLNCNPGIDPQRDLEIARRQADSMARQALAMGRQDIQTTYANLGEFVRRMTKLPGQRTLVVVSPGFVPLEADALMQESQVIEMAAQANVTISALDARGLYTTELDASQHSPDLKTQQPQGDYRRTGMMIAGNAMGALADGTGGTFFDNSNDLAGGFRKVAEAPEVVYVLELSLDGVKADGAYHKLKVKVDREGVEVQARRGYFMARAEKKKE